VGAETRNQARNRSCLQNEIINAVLIHQGLTAPERLAQLNTIAIARMCSLLDVTSVKRLGKAPER
jgi:hypothetical protein